MSPTGVTIPPGIFDPGGIQVGKSRTADIVRTAPPGSTVPDGRLCGVESVGQIARIRIWPLILQNALGPASGPFRISVHPRIPRPASSQRMIRMILDPVSLGNERLRLLSFDRNRKSMRRLACAASGRTEWLLIGGECRSILSAGRRAGRGPAGAGGQGGRLKRGA